VDSNSKRVIEVRERGLRQLSEESEPWRSGSRSLVARDAGALRSGGPPRREVALDEFKKIPRTLGRLVKARTTEEACSSFDEQVLRVRLAGVDPGMEAVGDCSHGVTGEEVDVMVEAAIGRFGRLSIDSRYGPDRR